MRTKESAILLVGLVKNSKTAIQSAANDLKAIRANFNSSNSALVLGLHEKLTEIEGPHSEVGILTASYTEGLID